MIGALLLDDSALLIQISQGSEKAFQKLFEIYHQQLGTYIYRISNSTELAEEVVQDVFLKIWTNRAALEHIKDIKGYLFIVSKHHMLNCIRKMARERMLKQEWEKSVLKEEIETKDTSTYYLLLDRAINQLSPQQKSVFLLSRHERLKYQEIAEKLQLSKETVKKYLQLATTSIIGYIRDNQEVVVYFYFFSIFL